MISPDAAWALVESALSTLAARSAPRTAGSVATPRGAALDRRLTAAVSATTDLPSADVSALDGYALAESAGRDGQFQVAGVALAGGSPAPALAPGEAARVMTGAPLPAGTTRVVGFEDAVETAGIVRISGAIEAGAAIRRRGEVVQRGDTLLAAGTRLSPAGLALLASQGIDSVETFAAPQVEILVTGDEVVRAGALESGKVRDSHSDFLTAELGRSGISPLEGPVVRDDRATLEARLAAALGRADVVLTCGGVSMGDADLVPSTLERLGCRTLFHGVAMQPGKPLLFAVRESTLVFGLPGNPGSVMTAYWLFVRPTLARLGGASPDEAAFWAPVTNVPLARPLAAGRGRDRFVPARLIRSCGRIEAEPTGPKGSHDLATFATAHALLRVRTDDPPRPAGECVEALPLFF